MKKTFIAIAALVCAALPNYAQSTDSSLDTLKATKGKFVTELNVNPFNGSISLNNSLNQIKFRYFATPRLAYRFGITANRIGTSEDEKNPYGASSYHYTEDKSSTTLGLNLGLEKHFKGTRRLSPYIGFDLSFVDKTSKQETSNGTITTNIKGAWYNVVYSGSGSNYTTQISENAFTSYGINLFSGFDFYMAKHFFFGYEFNFGFYQKDWKDVTVTQTGGSSSGNNNSSPDSDSSSFSFGSNLMNGIRIGYVF